MFYPQEMTEIELVVPERDVLAVCTILAEEGIFHQVDISHIAPEMGFEGDDYWQKKSTTYAALERRILAIAQALEVDEGAPPASPQANMIEVNTVDPSVERLEQETGRLADELANGQAELDKLERYVHQIESIADVDVDVSALQNLRYVLAMLGTIPLNRLERLQTSLARIPFVLVTLRKDSHHAVVLLLGTQSNSAILQRAARSAYLNPLDLPESYQGTPSQIIEALHADIERVQGHIGEQKSGLAELHDAHAETLRTWLWRIRISRMLADALASFGRLRYTYIVLGWVPAARSQNLTQRLRQVSGELIVETRTPKRYEAEKDVPVALEDPGIIHAFQGLVTNYGWPRYAEIDPTFLITLTFPLLFGAMFGDVGHGLMLILLGWLLTSRRVQILQGLANLGLLIIACGMTATAFGFLYGSLFGLEDVLPALWLRPLSNIMQVLMTTIGLGVVLLSIGFITALVNAWTARDWAKLLFDHNGVAGLVLYWSLIGLAAAAFVGTLPVLSGVFAASATVAGAVVMLSELLSRLVTGQRPLVDGGIGTYAVQAVFELFETLIGLLSNSLSYVRVGAFAVAHGGLSAVVFILAELVSPTHGVGYWIAVIFGNLFIVGFEGLIVGIQSLRLEYYEFFSKFFAGGGKRYTPLTLAPKTGK